MIILAMKKSISTNFFIGKYFQVSPKKAAFGSAAEVKSVTNDAPTTTQVSSPYNLRYQK